MDGRSNNGGARPGAGAPKGGKNYAKGFAWKNALADALNNYVSDTAYVAAGEALYRIAYGVVDRAIAGDKDAVTEIACRLDGKPHQSVSHSGEEGGAPIRIEWPLPRTKLDE